MRDPFDVIVPSLSPEVCDCHGTRQSITYQLTALAVCDGVINNLPRRLRDSSGYREVRNPARQPAPVTQSMDGYFAAVRNIQDFGHPDPIRSGKQQKAKSVPDPVMPERVAYGYDPKPLTNPAEVYDYIKRTYSPEEIRENYSVLRQQVAYGKPSVYKLKVDRPGTTVFNYDAKTNSYVPDSNNLTDRSNSAILEDAEQPEESHMLSREEAEAVFKRGAAALAEIDRLEAKYSPDLPDGSIIAFKLNFAPAHTGAPSYFHYAAIRAAGRWFTTGKLTASVEGGIGLEWVFLLECFEKLNGADFEVLRTGGITPELENVQEPTKSVKVPHGHTTIIPPVSLEHILADDDDDDDDYDPDDHAEDDNE